MLHLLARVADHEETLRSGRNNFLAKQRAAATFDQIQLRINFIGAVHIDVNLGMLFERGQRDSQLFRKLLGFLRGRDSDNLQAVADAFTEKTNRKGGRRTGPQADDASGVNHLSRGPCRRLLFMILFSPGAAHSGFAACLRKEWRMMALLMAKLPTAPSAAARTSHGLRCSAAGNNAASANRIPSAFSTSGGRALGSLRSRICNSTAAAPIAEITTTAAGLRNAAGLVKSTTSISAQQSRPEATTVLRCGSAVIDD